MRKKSRILRFALSIFLVLGLLSNIKEEKVVNAYSYNVEAAMSYAAAHWNDGQGECAEFVSRCVQAGGINISTYGFTIDCFNAVSSATGVASQDLRLDGNGYATKALDGNILSRGDVVIQWCYTHGTRPHILICSGYDSSGVALFYAHNGALNNGRYQLNRNYAYEHTASCNMGAKVLHISNANQDPVGCFDIASSDSPQKLFVRGWAFDPDNPSASINVHVYVGGEAGQPGVECFAIKADGVRDDVNKAYGITGRHGFSTTLTVSKSGSQKIAVYAINSTSGNNPRIGDIKTVNIKKDTEPPKISNARIYNVTSDGYDVSFDVSDNVGVTKAECPTWSDKGGQDDLVWHQATIKNGTATCHIKRSDHKNEYGLYITHVYAWDSQNNNVSKAMSANLVDPASIVKVQSIELLRTSSKDRNVYEGDTFSLAANITPSNATDKSLVWKSSDNSIATVDNYGNVKVASSLGGRKSTVTITASTKDNSVHGSYSISVFPKSGYCNSNRTVSFNVDLNNKTLDISGNGKIDITEYPWLGNFDFNKVTIGYGVTNISDAMFIRTRINELIIPESVTEIGDRPFSMMSDTIYCLTIPSSIKRMSGLALLTSGVNKVVFKSDAPELYGDQINIMPEIHVPCDAVGYENWPCDIYYDQPAIRSASGEQNGNNGSSGNNNTANSNTGNNNKNSYSNEWVNGKWYDINGNQTYSGMLQWKNNASGWWVEDTTGWYPTDTWQKIDGIWYYFKPDGYMASSEYYHGYWFNKDGSWDEKYYLTWKSNSKGWWVEDKSGWWPANSWLKIDGYWYYFNSSGYMVTSQYVDGYWISANGICY